MAKQRKQKTAPTYYCPHNPVQVAQVKADVGNLRNWKTCPINPTAGGHTQWHPCLAVKGNNKSGGVLLLAGAVGNEEDKRGEPYGVEAEGELHTALQNAGIPLSAVTIINICRCCPSSKKPPAKAITLCSKLYALPLVKSLKPAVVVPLGGPSLKVLVGGKGGTVTKMAGLEMTHPDPTFPAIVASVSPSYVLRNTHAYRTGFQQGFEQVEEVWQRVNNGGVSAQQVEIPKNVWAPLKASDFGELIKRLADLQMNLKYGDFLSYDVETTGLNPWAKNKLNNILTLSLSTTELDSLVIPFLHPQAPTMPPQVRAVVMQMLKDLLTDPKTIKVAHNMKFDNKWMEVCWGWHPTGAENVKGLPGCFDTMLAHAVTAPGHPHALDALTLRYCRKLYSDYWTSVHNEAKVKAAAQRKSQKRAQTEAEKREQDEQRMNFGLVDLPKLVEYNGYDTMVPIYLINHLLLEDLKKSNTLDVFRDTIMPASLTLQRIETSGMKVDYPTLKRMTLEYEDQINDLKQDFYGLPEVHAYQLAARGGERMNPNSTDQKKDLLFNHWKLPVTKHTPTGQPSTDKEAVKELLAMTTLPSYARETLENLKALAEASIVHNTFLTPVPGRVGTDGSIHCNYKLHQARTGRLSSSRPNFQNQPKGCRPIYRTRFENGFILSADFSQLESRVMACFCKDPAFLKIFREHRDFHIQNAGLMLGKDPGRAIKAGPNMDWGQVTKEDRQIAKSAVTFGLAYGRSSEALAKDLQITLEEAQKMRDTYFNSVPGLLAWIEAVVAWAKKHGGVRTATGRVRPLPDLFADQFYLVKEAERQAVNTVVQGTASDMTLRALTSIERQLRAGGFRAVPIVTVHDSIGVDSPPEEAQTVGELMVNTMQDVSMYPWASIPFTVELTAHPQWDA